MSKQELGHTQTKWRAHLGSWQPWDGAISIVNPDNKTVAFTIVDGTEREAAREIVDALNERATLLSQVRQKDEALREAYERIAKSIGDYGGILGRIEAALSLTPQPDDLHPATAQLVADFARALAEKLRAAEKKYGYRDGWLTEEWEAECREHLYHHLAKGDPRDVAAYCAFMWKRGWSTSQPDAAPADDIVARLRLHQIEEGKSFFALWDEAANEIERLRASPLPADDVVEAAAKELGRRRFPERELPWDELGETFRDGLREDAKAIIAVADLLRQSAPVEVKPNPYAGWKVPPYYNGEHDQGMGVPEKCKCGNALRLKPLGWECEKCGGNYGR